MESFKIPLQSEIAVFLREKKPDWPSQFTEWYANKIWLFYDQKNWMIGKNRMARWKSAVSLHFLDLKEDYQRELDKYKVVPIAKATQAMNGIDQINQAYAKYIQHPTVYDDQELARIYDIMKQYGAIKLDPDQVKICREKGELLGKSLAVRLCFENRANGRKII